MLLSKFHAWKAFSGNHEDSRCLHGVQLVQVAKFVQQKCHYLARTVKFIYLFLGWHLRLFLTKGKGSQGWTLHWDEDKLSRSLSGSAIKWSESSSSNEESKWKGKRNAHFDLQSHFHVQPPPTHILHHNLHQKTSFLDPISFFGPIWC